MASQVVAQGRVLQPSAVDTLAVLFDVGLWQHIDDFATKASLRLSCKVARDRSYCDVASVRFPATVTAPLGHSADAYHIARQMAAFLSKCKNVSTVCLRISDASAAVALLDCLTGGHSVVKPGAQHAASRPLGPSVTHLRMVADVLLPACFSDLMRLMQQNLKELRLHSVAEVQIPNTVLLLDGLTANNTARGSDPNHHLARPRPPALESLYLSWAEAAERSNNRIFLTSNILEPLMRLQNLRVLSTQHCFASSQLLELSEQLPSLHTLGLGGFSRSRPDQVSCCANTANFVSVHTLYRCSGVGSTAANSTPSLSLSQDSLVSRAQLACFPGLQNLSGFYIQEKEFSISSFSQLMGNLRARSPCANHTDSCGGGGGHVGVDLDSALARRSEEWQDLVADLQPGALAGVSHMALSMLLPSSRVSTTPTGTSNSDGSHDLALAGRCAVLGAAAPDAHVLSVRLGFAPSRPDEPAAAALVALADALPSLQRLELSASMGPLSAAHVAALASHLARRGISLHLPHAPAQLLQQVNAQLQSQAQQHQTQHGVACGGVSSSVHVYSAHSSIGGQQQQQEPELAWFGTCMEQRLREEAAAAAAAKAHVAQAHGHDATQHAACWPAPGGLACTGTGAGGFGFDAMFSAAAAYMMLAPPAAAAVMHQRVQQHFAQQAAAALPGQSMFPLPLPLGTPGLGLGLGLNLSPLMLLAPLR